MSTIQGRLKCRSSRETPRIAINERPTVTHAPPGENSAMVIIRSLTTCVDPAVTSAGTLGTASGSGSGLLAANPVDCLDAGPHAGVEFEEAILVEL